MGIKIGDALPEAILKILGEDGIDDIHTSEYLEGRKIVIFGVPGAFTPACSQKHLPGYVQKADQLRSEGVDEIICVAVNDPFVMKAWGDASGANGKVTMLSDWDGFFVEALGLSFDGSAHALGKRACRFMMIVDNGIVRDLQIEEKGSDVSVSSAESCALKIVN